MNVFDSKLLKRFLKLAGQDLTGDWVLIGGTVLPALGINHRSTTDIDLIGLTNKQQTQTLKLMELADKLGLPIESINQAGAYFLSKIPDYQKQLVVLYRGKSAAIFRPNATLFIKLKISRLSVSDLADCMMFLDFADRSKEPYDRIELKKIIQKESANLANSEKKGRLAHLLKRL